MLTDNCQIGEFWVYRSPLERSKIDISVMHLARSFVQELSEDKVDNHRHNIEQ